MGTSVPIFFSKGCVMCREYDMLCIDEVDGKFFLKKVMLVPRWEEQVSGPFDTIRDLKEFVDENELQDCKNDYYGRR